MGKMGASSWLSAVKKALSPTRGSERRGEQEEEDQKRGKRRWIFRKPSPYERTIEHKETKNIASPCNTKTTRRKKSTDQGKLGLKLPVFEEVDAPEQRQAMTTAEAVVATAQASVEVIRLATPSIFVAENYAVVAIQTAFRGYLARRALKALKGVVQLQAFVRGYNVRKRAKMTLRCMQSLLRVQNQVCDQRKRLSLSPLKNFYQIAETKSNSRSSTSSVTDDEYRPSKSKEATHKHENSLAHAFSRQIWRSENPQLYITRHQEDKRSSPRAIRISTTETATSSPKTHRLSVSLSSPLHSRAQNLLINSLSSPHRSRTRAQSKAHSEAQMAQSEAPSEASTPPRYMAETESAAARMRSQSAPRQRLERERERERDSASGVSSAKKRLSFAGQDLYSGV